MIKELIFRGYTEDKVVEILVDNGYDSTMARFIVDIELGRIDGDVISVNGEQTKADNGKHHDPRR